jgi:hypothetical protein
VVRRLNNVVIMGLDQESAPKPEMFVLQLEYANVIESTASSAGRGFNANSKARYQICYRLHASKKSSSTKESASLRIKRSVVYPCHQT